MIKADHAKWAEFIFNPYLKRLFKKSFWDFRVINELSEIDKAKSLLITPNHFSWWDGFFVYWLNKKVLSKKLFVMMLEEQLKRYWFFQKVGCYSIDLNDNRKMITSLKYSIELLSDPDNLVTIYPQGEIQPYDTKNITLKSGIEFLAKNCKTEFQVLPIAFRIHHTNERLPFVYVRFGKILTSKEISQHPVIFNEGFTDNINKLNLDYSNGDYKSIL